MPVVLFGSLTGKTFIQTRSNILTSLNGQYLQLSLLRGLSTQGQYLRLSLLKEARISWSQYLLSGAGNELNQYQAHPLMWLTRQWNLIEFPPPKNITQLLRDTITKHNTPSHSFITTQITDGAIQQLKNLISSNPIQRSQFLRNVLTTFTLTAEHYLRTSISGAPSDLVGFGDGTNTTFTTTLTYPPHTASVVIHYTINGVSYEVTADENGNIAGTYIAAGTIDPDGHLTLTFTIAPDIGSLILASYTRKMVDWSLKVDGVDFSTVASEVHVSQRESEKINHIEVTVRDPSKFTMCDPARNWGAERIQLTLGKTTYFFLLESREGSEVEFTIWGRAKAALLTEPFAERVDKEWVNRYASSIASELAGSIPLTWKAKDYFIPYGSFEGYPLDIIGRLARVVGAIVRTKPDGSLLVRPKFTVRPRNLSNVVKTRHYDRYTNLVSLDYSEELPTCNAVVVKGEPSGHEVSFTLEMDSSESCYEAGVDSAYIRVYSNPIGFPYEVTSTGTITKVYGTRTKEVEETITITNESGSLRYPVYKGFSYNWVGKCQGDVIRTGKTLHIIGCKCGVLHVKYTTKYDVYKVSCEKLPPDEKERPVLVCVVVPEEAAAVSVKVVMGKGDKECDPIEDELIATESVAVARGKAFLDDNYYLKRKFTFRVPYEGAVDGEVADLEDDVHNLYGRGLIRQANIVINLSGSTRKIWQDLEVVCFENPPS